MTAAAFKVVEGRTMKGKPVLYAYSGERYMGSLFCTPGEAEQILSAFRIGFDEMHVSLETSAFDHVERTS